ncbi:MAG: ATP-binding cassette domain-containing protein [Candidatus Hydrogenedentota bacterium]|uniref:Putative ABC transporter ATP-binding protein n=1 Tax=Sumerlaea chitinivorans TaxID=2250252 RepID=A0A2Z4Y8K0_SUMC1|nr:putative ABC transporter ATP-binding protein [Candidatus Sumerlaea chitinivorans]RMH24676.1 MAG: ATP-binding cassette domain-containing protein [Candidatus Hydrogenedentota bacterium]GIX44666.1 MAG: putative ABC transporter ATP-binding protein YlmA [Candidatus Sumerlaea sp.]
MANVVVELSDVSLTRERRQILSEIRWLVRGGEHWVLFGPNGAGKTTLLNLLTGYIWPTDGEVAVLGQRFGETDLSVLRRRIAMVSDQLAQRIHGELTGLEILITGGRAHLNLFQPASTSELRTAAEVATAMGVVELLEKPFRVLSSGERQRLLIARALMRRPALLILDEPCAGLDLAGREFVLETIRRAASWAHPPTIIFTTHHVEEITPVFTHALLLRAGRVFASGPLRKVLTSRTLSSLFEMPIRVVWRDGRCSARAESLDEFR